MKLIHGFHNHHLDVEATLLASQRPMPSFCIEKLATEFGFIKKMAKEGSDSHCHLSLAQKLHRRKIEVRRPTSNDTYDVGVYDIGD
ncbi:hypothetical protein LINPERPRIM_LOCUS1160 [Linum perenne]